MGGRHVTEDYILCSASVMTPILETALTENNCHEKTFGSESFHFFFYKIFVYFLNLNTDQITIWANYNSAIQNTIFVCVLCNYTVKFKNNLKRDRSLYGTPSDLFCTKHLLCKDGKTKKINKSRYEDMRYKYFLGYQH